MKTKILVGTMPDNAQVFYEQENPNEEDMSWIAKTLNELKKVYPYAVMHRATRGSAK